MRIAVLLCGFIRTWNESKNKEWLEKYDVFASTYHTCKNMYTPFILEHFSTKEEPVDESQFKDFKKILWYSPYDNPEKKIDPKMQVATRSYYQFACFKRGLDLISEYEEEKGMKYDVIIKTRFDLDYEPVFANFTDVIISALNNPEVKLILNNRESQPSDFVFIGKRKIIHNLADFCVRQFFEPSLEGEEISSHGILKKFLSKLPLYHVTPIALIKRPYYKLKIALCLGGYFNGYFPFDINNDHDIDVYISAWKTDFVLPTKCEFWEVENDSEVTKEQFEKGVGTWYKIYRTKRMLEQTKKKYDLIISCDPSINLRELFPFHLALNLKVIFIGKCKENKLIFFGSQEFMLKIMAEYENLENAIFHGYNDFLIHSIHRTQIPNRFYNFYYGYENVGKDPILERFFPD